MLCMLSFGASLVSCSDDDDDSLDDDGSKVTLPQTRVYILNEGSQGANNAGLAFYAPNKDCLLYTSFVPYVEPTTIGID